MTGVVRATVSLGNIRRNLQTVRELAPSSKVLAVIKADAYGHGAIEVAKALDDADAFAVARLNEAIILRGAGVDKPIRVLSGWHQPEEISSFVRHDLGGVVHDPAQIRMLDAWSVGVGAPAPALDVWLKCDTGMGRLGVSPDALAHHVDELNRHQAVAPGIVVMTHFACADDLSSDMTRRQVRCLRGALAGLDVSLSMANSPALLAWPTVGEGDLGTWVRPGLMLYGVSPFVERSAVDCGLAPAMEFSTQVIALKTLAAGASVGYGATWCAERDTTIAVVAAGYADGLDRGLPTSSRADADAVTVIHSEMLEHAPRARVGAASYPVVGRIAMDLAVLDVGAPTTVEVGDRVVLWGPGAPLEILARQAGTIPYELLVRMSGRVERDYVE
jgi:alanine racemase